MDRPRRDGTHILIAGAGNVLRGDDGFGIALAQRLEASGMPEGVTIMESGMAGMTLVQEMLNGYDGLIVIDVVLRRKPPGTLVMLEPQVPEIASLTESQRADFYADTHQADPSRSLMLARALGCLPARVRIVGCEPQEVDDCVTELTPAVAAALPEAERMVRDTVRAWLAELAAEPVPA